MSHELINGGEAHQFTDEERSLGGSRTKFNNLRHGRYAQKFYQTFICSHCNLPTPIQHIKEQDALLAKLTNKQELYEEIKSNMVRMKEIVDDEQGYHQFDLLLKYNKQMIQLWERLTD